MLTEAGCSPHEVHGIGLDVPGPVDFATGRVISPPIMSGWDGYDIPGWFRPGFDCPVLLENDVNAMAFGEQRTVYPDTDSLLVVKVGTGVGAGIITVALVRQAGRLLGRAVADAVSLLNPRVVVLGGQLSAAEEQLMAGVREMVYSRSLPLATSRRQITRSTLGQRAAVIGTAMLLADLVFAPERVDRALA
jgi:predicted NBD/HSP70 family sugar kinase